MDEGNDVGHHETDEETPNKCLIDHLNQNKNTKNKRMKQNTLKTTHDKVQFP